MTAVATFQDAQGDRDVSDGAWLVPDNSIQQSGGVSTLQVIRDGAPVTVTVIPGEIQGDWRLVESEELASGDEVIGSVSTYLSTDTSTVIGPGGPRGPGASAQNP